MDLTEVRSRSKMLPMAFLVEGRAILDRIIELAQENPSQEKAPLDVAARFFQEAPLQETVSSIPSPGVPIIY